MSMGKVVISRQTNLNMPSASSTEDDNKKPKIKKPQLLSWPIKKSGVDTRTALGNFGLGSLTSSSSGKSNSSEDSNSSEESKSVIVQVSDETDSSDSSESVCVSGAERVATKRVEAKTQDANDDVSQSEDLYCSEPNIKVRCTLSLMAMSATTALGVLVVMTAKGDESISYQATWIGVAALSGLALSAAAGLGQFVYSHLGKPAVTAAATQPA